jgi:hypothetical protein
MIAGSIEEDLLVWSHKDPEQMYVYFRSVRLSQNPRGMPDERFKRPGSNFTVSIDRVNLSSGENSAHP